MKEQLKFLAEIIENVDADPRRSMQYITTATSTTTVQNKPPDDCRWDLITDIIFKMNYQFTQDEQESQKQLDNFMLKLNNYYQQNQDLCWKAHEHHFHKDIAEYIKCPTTCLYEISEFLNKLIRRAYAQ